MARPADPDALESDEASPPASILAPAPVARLLEVAESLQGMPYRAAGVGPDAFDCSGFVQYVFSQVGVNVPRSVRDQQTAGIPVEDGDLRPGDLVFFAIDRRVVSHVGIALGDDRFIHAPSERGVVRNERLSAGYWSARFAGARRVIGEQ